MKKKIIVYVVNVDWYFALHWQDRAVAAQQAGYEVYVVTHFTDNTFKSEMCKRGISCLSIALKRSAINPFRELICFLKLYFLLRKIRPDLIHCITVKPNIYGGFVGRFLRCPCILSVTGLGIISSNNLWWHRLLKTVLKMLYRSAVAYDGARLLFENSDDQAYFVSSSIIDGSRSEVIKGAGVDTQKYSYCEYPDNSPPVLLFAARLLRGKGFGDLVRASEILKERKISCRVKVAGIIDKDCLEAIPMEEILQNHEDGLIEWIGQRNDMPEILQQADIIVLPTTYGEGVPRILIEGAAIGRALVANDVVGCRDIIIHEYNGLLVHPNDHESLANALQQLIENKNLRILFGKRGRALVEEEFAQTKVIDKTLDLYERTKDAIFE